MLSVAAAAPFVPLDPPAALYQLAAKGEISPARDVDFYSLGRLRAGDVLSVTQSGLDSARGTLGDCLVELYRAGPDPSSPVLVALNDDGGSGFDAYVYRFRVAVDDAYLVKCRASNPPLTGTYDLAVWLEAAVAAPPAPAAGGAPGAGAVESEPNDTPPEADDLAAAWRPVSQVSWNAGTIAAAGEAAADEYAVDLRPGDVLSIGVRSGAEVDAAVSLVDPSGRVVAVDLESIQETFGHMRDADLFGYSVVAGGSYSVRVWAKARTTGPYRLDLLLSRAPDAPPAAVVARHVFYNHSAFDNHSPGAAPDDDRAVATDKIALMPGDSPTPANVTGYARGINGVMIDVAGLRDDPGAGDFALDVSPSDAPGEWATAPAPSSVTRRPGAGEGGSDRITVIWPDGAILDCWLRVTLRASPATGLAADDTFLFGNLAGETGDDPAAAAVGPADLLRARARQTARADVTDPCDFNRDGRVNALDVAVARGRAGHALSAAPSSFAAPATTPPDPIVLPPRRRADPRRRDGYETAGAAPFSF